MSKGGKNAPVTRRRRWYSRRSSRRRKGSSTGCNGWTPSKGKWKGKGGFCADFGWSRKWCYTNKDFKGPGHEFIKPSESSPGKFYMPCKTNQTVVELGDAMSVWRRRRSKKVVKKAMEA